MSSFATRRSLAADFQRLGIAAGDAVLVHAALRRLGPVVGGSDAILDALLDVLGPDGTVLAYCDWQLDDALRDDPAFRDDIPPFDPQRSRANRDNGFFPELLRTTPGARRSDNPGTSVAALGARADWFVAGHALDYGYGPESPFGKLVTIEGKVLMLGAPLDTMTLLHHAEHLARIPGKRVISFAAPILVDGRRRWRHFEEFDTSNPVAEGLDDDYFATVVAAFLARGLGRRGTVAAAEAVLVPAAEMVRFAVAWLESRLPQDPVAAAART